MLDKKLIYVSGLPRSGSTLLCQLLSTHPAVYSPGHSSPLLHALLTTRQALSEDSMHLAQLDLDFERGYERLTRSARGFVNGWFDETDKAWAVDKNRGWLRHLDLLNTIDPDFRMVICIREPGQILGSIEAQHRRTVLLDFTERIGGMAEHLRAVHLMGPENVVGLPMQSIRALGGREKELQSRLYYLVFEHLISEPQTALAELYAWLGLPPAPLDLENLPVRPHESDSHYHFKFRHETRSKLAAPSRHDTPPVVEKYLRDNFGWFYETFYPGLM